MSSTPVDSSIAKYFARHLVAFGCSYYHIDENGNQCGPMRLSVYSGFVMSFRNIWFYVTAGHAFAQFDDAISDPRVKVRSTFLADFFGIHPKSDGTFPFDCSNGRPVNFCDDSLKGLDFGFTPIQPHERRWLEANGIVALDEVQWRRQDGLEFDAHLLLGIPEHLTKMLPQEEDADVKASVNPTLLQLVEEPQPADVQSEHSWYVGRIPPRISIDSLVGMSGGPVFGLKILEGEQIKYWVIGLQSWWRPDERLAFACRLTAFAPIIEEWLNEQIEQLEPDDKIDEM